MDPARFDAALQQTLQSPAREGIGTLSEKSVHAVLKRYYEPYGHSREIRVGPYIADIVGENGIIEIQTRAFHRLRKKLEAFLAVAPVTVIYPVAQIRYLSWIDPASGERVSRRRCASRGGVYSLFAELDAILPLLKHPGLQIGVAALEVEETRLLDGYGPSRKKRATRGDRVPTRLLDEYMLRRPADYERFLPAALPASFTSRDLAAAAKIPPALAQATLRVLSSLGVVQRTGTAGRAFLYTRV